ncbi:hypothetical protein Ddye_016202 [Dipteronia dyeriana]|uniref:Ribosomal protein S7 n=1 Tax=Dipteronia dyeriana TaxID=168575 RepID=A0AAD9U723_9ROSI|nr:hypothetical protein Ddye_016202 [Dipteronia dyeriana]
MSRRGTTEEKTAKSDPIYRNRLVNMLVNRILKHGKKSLAYQIIYRALKKIQQKTEKNPLSVLRQAIRGVTPDIAVKARRLSFRSRKSKHVVIFTDNRPKPNNSTYINTKYTKSPKQAKKVNLTHYSQQSDFRRGLIKGSMRAQRRKTITWELFQANVHSPLFLDRLDKPFYFSFDISELMKVIFKNWMWKQKDHKLSDSQIEKKNKMDNQEEDSKSVFLFKSMLIGQY